jgi:hypothetical protein
VKPPDLTEDERNELTVLALLEILERFGDPVKRPGKLIPFPKPTKRGPSRSQGRPRS